VKLILNQLSASSGLACFQVAKHTHFTQNVTLRLKACNGLISTVDDYFVGQFGMSHGFVYQAVVDKYQFQNHSGAESEPHRLQLC
jgi:hypothetical protein